LRENIAICAPNDGGWYNFGFLLGVVVFGAGAKRGDIRVVRR
jgi:hypothetical protein